VFKGGNGQVKIEALNLIATSNDLRRTVGENYIEDVQMVNLRN
jgi:hypothetical protein